MCWMSAVIDDAAKTHGYVTGGEGTQTTKLHKIIYADDGTYFARTKEGMQYKPLHWNFFVRQQELWLTLLLG